VARKNAESRSALNLGRNTTTIDSTYPDPSHENCPTAGGARVIPLTGAQQQSSPLVRGLARSELIVPCAGGGDRCITPFPSSSGSAPIVGTSQSPRSNGERYLAFSALQGIRAMSKPFHSPRPPEAYRRNENNGRDFASCCHRSIAVLLSTGSPPVSISGIPVAWNYVMEPPGIPNRLLGRSVGTLHYEASNERNCVVKSVTLSSHQSGPLA